MLGEYLLTAGRGCSLGTRDRIIDAAEQTIREYGIAGATTKRIAVRAACSEALIYKHFQGKVELFMAVLMERMPALAPALARLHGTVGKGDVQANLTEFAGAALTFYGEAAPIAAGLLSEPALMAEFKALLAVSEGGPHKPIRVLADYLRAEQQLGRVHGDPDAMASLIMGACYQRAHLARFVDMPDVGYADSIVGELLRR